MACKPDPVTPSRGPTAIRLGPPLRTGSSSQPGSLGRENPGPCGPRDPYLALLLAGLAMPPTSPPARWALTPPFHPCRPSRPRTVGRRSDLCGAFPRVSPGGRYPPPSLPGVRTFLAGLTAPAAVRPSAPAPDRGGRRPRQRRAPARTTLRTPRKRRPRGAELLRRAVGARLPGWTRPDQSAPPPPCPARLSFVGSEPSAVRAQVPGRRRCPAAPEWRAEAPGDRR